MDFVEYTEISADFEGRVQAQLELPTKGKIMNYVGMHRSFDNSTEELDESHEAARDITICTISSEPIYVVGMLRSGLSLARENGLKASLCAMPNQARCIQTTSTL